MTKSDQLILAAATVAGFILAILTVWTCNAGAQEVCPPRGVTVDADVVRVLDGDTLIVRSSITYRVRLLDCWAPELHRGDDDARLAGKASREFLINAIGGRTLRVHVPIAGELSRAFTFGRVLGRAWIVDEDGTTPETDLSETMVAGGHATKAKQR